MLPVSRYSFSVNLCETPETRVSSRTLKMPAVIVVHGGAWAIPDEMAEASVAGVKVAGREGYSVLKRGGSSLDAVEAAVRSMEDNSVFNAGTCRHNLPPPPPTHV